MQRFPTNEESGWNRLRKKKIKEKEVNTFKIRVIQIRICIMSGCSKSMRVNGEFVDECCMSKIMD